MTTRNQYAELANQINSAATISQSAAQLSAGAAVLSLVLIGMLHIVKSDMEPSWHMVSEYAIGGYGWIMKISFFAWSLSCISLLSAIRNQVKTKGGKIGLVLLFLVGISLIMAGIFVMDSPQTPKDEVTMHGNLHGIAAMIGMPGQAIAAMLISVSLTRNSQWVPVKRGLLLSAHFTWISFVILIATIFIMLSKTNGQFGPETLIGWPNRLVILAYCLWLIIVARKAMKLASEIR